MRYRIVVIGLLLLTSVSSCGVLSNIMAYTVTLDNRMPINHQIISGNRIYIVKQDFNLHGEKVNIPEGCTLKFISGSIRNGTLSGAKTVVQTETTRPIFYDLKLTGTFTAKEFPINAFITDKLDYFYGFLQAFSGTELYLTDDYRVMQFQGEIDRIFPEYINIDGRGHKICLYSFGAYKVKKCKIRNITVESCYNIEPESGWKKDKYNFGIVGGKESSIEFKNVTFTKECDFAYIRGFKNLEISDCIGEGSYFFIYECDNILFYNNKIANAPEGFHSIGGGDASNKVQIFDNHFLNINGGGIILTGGLKYNVNIVKNELVNVGSGGAAKSCINIHPGGTTIVKGNKIIANKGAATLDIDAARINYYSDRTSVSVEDNVIENIEGDTSIHNIALVGLGKLYFMNNKVRDQRVYFWDTPYMEFCNNTVSFTKGFDASTEIGVMSTGETTVNKPYQHVFENNFFDIPESTGTVHFKYRSNEPIRIVGKGNKYSSPVDFVDQYKMFEASGDIKIYK